MDFQVDSIICGPCRQVGDRLPVVVTSVAPLGMASHSFQIWFWPLWTWALGKSQVGNSMCFDLESIGELANPWRGGQVLVHAVGVGCWVCVQLAGWIGRRAGVPVPRLFIRAARGRDACVDLWCRKQKIKKIWHPKFTVSFARRCRQRLLGA